MIVIASIYGGLLLIGPGLKGSAPKENYIVFMLLAGMLLIIGELVAEKIMCNDHVKDQLYRRTGKLVLLLLSAGEIMSLLFLLSKVLL